MHNKRSAEKMNLHTVLVEIYKFINVPVFTQDVSTIWVQQHYKQ